MNLVIDLRQPRPLRELVMKTTAIPALHLELPSRHSLTARLPDFVMLMKPRVMALALFTALVGLFIAPGHLDALPEAVAILAIAAGMPAEQ